MLDLENELRDSLSAAAASIKISAKPWPDYQHRTHNASTGRRRIIVGLSLASMAAATAGIIALALVLSSAGPGHHPSEIAGGRSIVLTPNRPLSAQDLQRSARVVQERLHALGVTDATVVTAGSALQAQVPVKALNKLAVLAGQRGVFRVRQVLSTAAPTPARSSDSGPTESPTLNKTFLRSFDAWDCQSDPNPTQGADLPTDYIVACSKDRQTKYLLGPSAVNTSEITSASSENQNGIWQVEVALDTLGAAGWQQVTAKAFNVTHGQPSASCAPPAGCNAVALNLDGVVRAAPYISQPGGITGGHLQIAGGLTQADARSLAAILAHGALPTTFRTAAPATNR